MTNPERRGESPATVPPPSVEVLELTTINELDACVELQHAIWQASDVELVPVSQLRAAQHAGGVVGGARLDGELVGFCYGFPAFRPAVHDGPGLHSHMTGVVAKARSRGVGRALKLFQRSWCLERGISWMEWTFDPLRAANARFNLEHLGATANEYLADTYGHLDDSLNAGLPSDRLMTCWTLDRRAEGDDRSLPDSVKAVLTADEQGRPNEPRLGESAAALIVEIPSDLGGLLESAPETALAWRLSSRAVLEHYFGRGFMATRFVGGAYRLERPRSIE